MHRLFVRLFIALAALVCGLVMVVLGTLLYGEVSGQEFAPDTFEHRTYTYFELPLVRLQVTPVSRAVSCLPLARYLTTNGYIRAKTPPQRWDFVISYRWGDTWQVGDARILRQYLEAWMGEPEPYWQDWTKEHPEMAKIFWPEVAKLAQQELYLFTPDLFRLAADATESDAFAGDLKQLLARKYEERGQLELALANHASAVQFFTEALGYEPDREASLRGRALARQALGPSAAEQPDTLPPPTAEQEEAPEAKR